MPSTISAGTTAGTAIAIAGDTTGNLAFQTNGTTTAMTIDTSQNVGIGTTSPSAKLTIFNAGNGYGQFNYGNTAEDGTNPLIGSLNNVSPAAATTGWGIYDSNSTGNLVIYRRNFSTTGTKTAEWNRSNGNFSFDSGYGSAAVAYGCRAWANFNGTNAGTITPRASGNITSLTKNTTGDYTANFTNAMPDANYAVLLTTGGTGNSFWFRTYEDATPRTASAFRFITVRFNDGANQDAAQVSLAVFR